MNPRCLWSLAALLCLIGLGLGATTHNGPRAAPVRKAACCENPPCPLCCPDCPPDCCLTAKGGSTRTAPEPCCMDCCEDPMAPVKTSAKPPAKRYICPPCPLCPGW
jgi:hypothetical protein